MTLVKQITRTTFLMGMGGAAALAVFGAKVMTQAARPNVLLVFDDDHPPYMMDPMPVVKKGIRDRGVNSRGGHADIPLCGPNRVSLLTGLSVTTHLCDTNPTYALLLERNPDLEDLILPRFLREAGYRTAHAGKYVNGRLISEPVPRHWDRWWQTEQSGQGDDGAEVNANGAVKQIGEKPSMWAARQVEGFIRSMAGSVEPWLAHYCPTIPHQPYEPTSESEHLFDGDTRDVPSTNEADLSDKPAWMQKLGRVGRRKINPIVEGKKEELADLDRECIAPVLNALEETGQMGNTLVVFTSDNGYLAGEHRLAHKDQPYWESAQVPFFWSGPGVGVGASSGAHVSTVDIAPTVLEAAGIDPGPLGMDGRVVDLATGESGRKRMLVTGSDDVGPEQNPDGANNPTGRWWLLAEGDKRFILRENGAKELYRTNSDPFQNRSRDEEADPALIRRLTEAVEAMRAARGEERRRLEGAP